MKKLFLTFTIALLFNACSKDDPKQSCERNKTATVVVTSTSDNPYNFYNNGNFVKIINPQSTESIEIAAGTHFLEVVQVSGYVITPTRRSLDRDFKQCTSTAFKFP